MTVTTTTRLGLTRWSQDEDPFTRSQMDASHSALETNAAKFTSGTSLPTPSSASARSLFYKTDTGVMYFFNGTDNTGSWVAFTGFGGTPSSLTFGGSNSAGSSSFAARVDHTHAVPDPNLQNLTNYVAKAIVDAKGDLIAGTASDTVSRFAVGTNGQILSANSATATGLQWINPASTLIVSNTMPASPVAGDLWFDTTTGRMFVYYDSFFVETGTATDFTADLINAKGDLLVGTADDTPTRVAVGADGTFLQADSGQTTGVKWSSFEDDQAVLAGQIYG